MKSLILVLSIVGFTAAMDGGAFPLWDQRRPVPSTAELPQLAKVQFHVIKPYEFQRDGYRFLHGVALAWHRGTLFASFGHNKGGENTDSEQARYTTSRDGGRTWSEVKTVDPGDEPEIGVSHGVFLIQNDQLWAFHGAYRGTLQNVHMRAYRFDESSGDWKSQGVVLQGGFWPLGEPVQLRGGNWIIAGFKVGDGNPPAVAISHGNDLTGWDLAAIPVDASLGKVWGESDILVDGSQITCIARYGEQAKALVSTSADDGRTWTKACPADLPMATSKPCTGVTSTGQRYLICSTTSDGGGRRSPLTIAVSRPGETKFSRVFCIRPAVFPEGPGESHEKAALAYPCAVEHEGKLYVGYSNSGGKAGRIGSGRELANNNSAELAVIPLESLRWID